MTYIPGAEPTKTPDHERMHKLYTYMDVYIYM